VLGDLDDLVIVPAMIAAAVRLIPPSIMAEYRELTTAALDRPSAGRCCSRRPGLDRGG
jgi:hypothetical protein